MKQKSQLDMILQIEELNPMSINDLERKMREKENIKKYEMLNRQSKKNLKKKRNI
jgi:hypothetical protein